MNQVIILCGGKGTRLKSSIPKSLVKIKGKPILTQIITNCVKNKFKLITLKTGFKHKLLKSTYQYGQLYNCKIDYKRDTKILGTAGGLDYLSYLVDPVFILYGDVLNNVNMQDMLRYHTAHKADVTIAVHPSSHPEDSDVLVVNRKNQVTKVVHKPRVKKYGRLTNAAMYIINPSVFKLVPGSSKYDFGRDLVPLLLKKQYSVIAYPVTEKQLYDIGTPERLAKARQKR